jgi:two-component system, OmpR family, sensor kinase
VPIRLRVTLVFALALAVAFTLGGWLFVSRLSAAMLKSTDAALAARLSQAGLYTEDDGNPRSPGVTRGKPAPGEYIIQIVGPSGRVTRASPDAGNVPLLTAAQLQQARHGGLTVTRILDDEPERFKAAPVAEGHGSVAIAGISLESNNATLRQVISALAIGGAVFVIVAGIGAYWLARAALAPVERLRREVAALSEQDTGSTVQVPRTRDEIAALAGTMNDLLARLHGALARQRAFVADASHELRTPFAVLRGELELAGRPGRSSEELRAAVASAAEEAERLTRITDDLLLLARGAEATLVPRLARTDVAQLLAQSAERASGRAAAAGVTCRVDAPAGLVAMADAGRLRQAVDNLVDNALRFAPRDSEVTISAEMTGPMLVIEVCDRGPGFPPSFLPRAFERFARPDQGRARDSGGAGLGLSIVQAIAQAHGGRAVAANRAGGGASVRLEIPCPPPVPGPAGPGARGTS